MHHPAKLSDKQWEHIRKRGGFCFHEAFGIEGEVFFRVYGSYAKHSAQEAVLRVQEGLLLPE